MAFLYAAATAAASGQSHWYLFGKDIEAFSQTHSGIYAMGDCAGTAGYLMRQPLVQLEGLVMDTAFLQNIRDRHNLNQVLDQYGVRYYVTIDVKRADGCYNTTEPIQAGPDSPHMHGSFCQMPIAIFSHGTKTAYIFDLRPTNLPTPTKASMALDPKPKN